MSVLFTQCFGPWLALSSALAGLLISQVNYKTEMEKSGNCNPYVREQKRSCCVLSILCCTRQQLCHSCNSVLKLIPCMTLKLVFAELEAHYLKLSLWKSSNAGFVALARKLLVGLGLTSVVVQHITWNFSCCSSSLSGGEKENTVLCAGCRGSPCGSSASSAGNSRAGLENCGNCHINWGTFFFFSLSLPLPFLTAAKLRQDQAEPRPTVYSDMFFYHGSCITRASCCVSGLEAVSKLVMVGVSGWWHTSAWSSLLFGGTV